MTTLRTPHVGIMVSDLDRSVAFYRDVLGLALVRLEERSGPDVDARLGSDRARFRKGLLAAATPRVDVELIEYVRPRRRPLVPELLRREPRTCACTSTMCGRSTHRPGASTSHRPRSSSRRTASGRPTAGTTTAYASSCSKAFGNGSKGGDQ